MIQTDKQTIQNVSINREIDSVVEMHRFSHRAMATIYEVYLIHEDATYAQEAALEAFFELDKLEQELSRFIENSDISRINSLASNQSTRVGLAVFECLRESIRLSEETDGAFDISVGPLLKCWLNEDKSLRTPSEDELHFALQNTGIHLLELHESEHEVKVHSGSLQIDLGGIGKGYAIDQLAGFLREWDFENALIHGGFSSVYALGAPPAKEGWPLTLSHPNDRNITLEYLHLRDQAISGSGLQKGQHIIDPRSGKPVKDNLASWTCASNAVTTDALSTAFMLMSTDEVENYCQRNKDVRAMILVEREANDSGQEHVLRFGSWEQNAGFI